MSGETYSDVDRKIELAVLKHENQCSMDNVPDPECKSRMEELRDFIKTRASTKTVGAYGLLLAALLSALFLLARDTYLLKADYQTADTRLRDTFVAQVDSLRHEQREMITSVNQMSVYMLRLDSLLTRR